MGKGGWRCTGGDASDQGLPRARLCRSVPLSCFLNKREAWSVMQVMLLRSKYHRCQKCGLAQAIGTTKLVGLCQHKRSPDAQRAMPKGCRFRAQRCVAVCTTNGGRTGPGPGSGQVRSVARGAISMSSSDPAPHPGVGAPSAKWCTNLAKARSAPATRHS